MNSLQSFSAIIGGVFLLPILIGVCFYRALRPVAEHAGSLLVGLLALAGPLWFAYMVCRLIYLKLLS